jgi:hypothetical protein
VSESEMDRAYRKDYAYECACKEAARALQVVLDSPRMEGQADARKSVLWGAQNLLAREAAHIVAVWD